MYPPLDFPGSKSCCKRPVLTLAPMLAETAPKREPRGGTTSSVVSTITSTWVVLTDTLAEGMNWLQEVGVAGRHGADPNQPFGWHGIRKPGGAVPLTSRGIGSDFSTALSAALSHWAFPLERCIVALCSAPLGAHVTAITADGLPWMSNGATTLARHPARHLTGVARRCRGAAVCF